MVLILGLRSLCHKRAPLRSHHPAAKPPCKTIGHHHHYLVPHASTIRHFHRPQALFGHHHLSTCPLSSRARPLHGGLHMRFFNAARQLGASVFDEVSRARSWPQKGPTTGKWPAKGRSWIWAHVLETLVAGSGQAGRARANAQAQRSTRTGFRFQQRSAPRTSSKGRARAAPKGFSTFNTATYYKRKGLAFRQERARSPATMALHFQCRLRSRTGLTYFLLQGPEPKPAPVYKPGTLAPRRVPPTVVLASLAARAAPAPAPTLVGRSSGLRPTFRPFDPQPKLLQASPSTIRYLSRASTRPQQTPAKRAHRQAGLHILWPIATALKSSTALHAITVVTRVALTVLPLSLRAKVVYGLRQRYLRDPERASALLRRFFESSTAGGTVATPSRSMRFNSAFLFPTLLLAPLALLAATVLASLERTPVTGRLRIMMLSPQEEADLVSSTLGAGATVIRQGRMGLARDWVQILRSVLQLPDEGVSATTGRRILLGGEVLDERDWRYRWTEAVLRKLEEGIPMMTAPALKGDETQNIDSLRPPPTSYPLKPRPSAESAHDLGWQGKLILSKHHDGSTGSGNASPATLAPEYELLIIERDEANAFSFGFSVNENDLRAQTRDRRGVIVVYTGFIEQILSRGAPEALSPPPAYTGTTDKKQPPSLPAAISEYLEPKILPTMDQTHDLAVLLSHELSHIVLSHTLESYASTSLLIPHLSKLVSDVFRTIIFPFTAILGPFFNDAIGKTMNEGASTGFGALGQAAHSCESRKLELEADLVALRILSHAGIDPRVALTFWRNRLERPPAAAPSSSSDAPASSHLHLHSARSSSASSDGQKATSAQSTTTSSEPACLFNSHPVDAERVKRIQEELLRWVRWHGSRQAGETSENAASAA